MARTINAALFVAPGPVAAGDKLPAAAGASGVVARGIGWR